MGMRARPSLRLDQACIMIDANAHVRIFEGLGWMRQKIGQVQSGRIRAALDDTENEITVLRHTRALPTVQLLQIAGQPAEADVVALVQTHQGNEAAWLGAP